MPVSCPPSKVGSDYGKSKSIVARRVRTLMYGPKRKKRKIRKIRKIRKTRKIRKIRRIRKISKLTLKVR